ncbi:hypothetical protein J3F84DRAFT_354670 [Trichoderma pleuroticola]
MLKRRLKQVAIAPRRSTALCTVQQRALKILTMCGLCLGMVECTTIVTPTNNWLGLYAQTTCKICLPGVQDIKPCPVLAFFHSSHSRGPLQLAPAFLRRRCARLGKTETKHWRNRIRLPLNWKRSSSCRLMLFVSSRLVPTANAPRQTHL